MAGYYTRRTVRLTKELDQRIQKLAREHGYAGISEFLREAARDKANKLRLTKVYK